jgi:hypothetical protein
MNLVGLLALAIPLPETPRVPEPPDTLTALSYDITTCIYCGVRLLPSDTLGACPGCLQGDD